MTNRKEELTALQNLLHFAVVGTESTVQLKVICVIEKRAAQGEEKFLEREERGHIGGAVPCLLGLRWHLLPTRHLTNIP